MLKLLRISGIVIVLSLLLITSVACNQECRLHVITKSGQGIVSPSYGEYTEGTRVIITAIPHSGCEFLRWEGDWGGTQNPLTIVMDSDKTIWAYFNCSPIESTPTPTPTFTPTPTPTSTQVRYTISAINDSGGIIEPNGNVTVSENDDQAFTISPDANYRISDVLVDGVSVGTPSSYTFYSVSTNHTIAAEFTQTFNLSVWTNPADAGTISPDSGTYDEGTQVMIIANPEDGFRFDYWSGDASGSGNPLTVTMDSDKSITANMVATGNLIELEDTAHSYTKIYNEGNIDNSDGANSIDGDFNTRFGYGNSGGDPPAIREVTVISEHTFTRPVTLNQVTYSMYADARANGKYIREHSITMYVQYYDTDWHDIPGSNYSAGGGEGEQGFNTGTVSYACNLSNVMGIRAYCNAYSFVTGGEAGANSEAWIYELQAWGEMAFP